MTQNSDLEHRIARLSEELRNYPTPIARCDEQLADLLDRRAHLIAQRGGGTAQSGGCEPINVWINDGGLNGA